MAANGQGDHGILYRLRVHQALGQGVELPFECRALVAPEGAHDLDVLVTARPSMGPGHTASRILFPAPADPNAEINAAFGDKIERRILLGGIDRIRLRQDANTGTEP